jgi:hypothetical protein
MPGIEIARAVYAGFAGTLEGRDADFAAALEVHRTSVGLPAPVEASLVEAIARAGGMDAVTIVDPPTPPAPPDQGQPLTPLIPKLTVVERVGIAGKLRDARAALKIGRPDAELSDAKLLLRELRGARQPGQRQQRRLRPGPRHGRQRHQRQPDPPRGPLQGRPVPSGHHALQRRRGRPPDPTVSQPLEENPIARGHRPLLNRAF